MSIAMPSAVKRKVLLASASTLMSYARMPKLLAAAAMRVTVMAPPASPALASRHVSERIPVDGDVRAVRRHLRSLLLADPGRYDWVILCDEDLVTEVARYLGEHWADACFPVPADSEAPTIISGKSAFISACQSAGIAVPTSRICHGVDDALAAAGVIGYPLVLKADFGASGTTVWRIGDERELLAALPRTDGRRFVMQQLLTGEAGVTEMICRAGRPLAIVSSLMRGIDPAPFGPASSRLYRANPEAEALAHRIGALTSFNGFCGFDWMQCGGSDGATFAIEFHPRPTLGFHMARHAGVDFVTAVRDLFDSGATPALVQRRDGQQACHFFPKDLTRALRSRDLTGLWRWVPGVAYNDFPWGDPGLLGALVQRYVAGHRKPSSGHPAKPVRAPMLAPQSTAFHDDL